MKCKIILCFISIIAVSSLRISLQKREKLNPSSVKSPGGFENVAPDAKKIVTPIYANAKIQVNLRVDTQSLVQRDHPLGTTLIPKVATVIDQDTKTSELIPYNEMKAIHATSSVWAKTHNFENITVDMKSGKSIPEPNTANQPKVLHGKEQ